MLVFTDIVSGDEVFADSFPHEVEGDVVYVIQTKSIRVEEGEYVAANVDEDAAEGAVAEGYESKAEVVNNLEHGYNLCQVPFDKKAYLAYLKSYFAQVKAHLLTTNPDRVAPFMKAAQDFAKKIVGSFNDYLFYTTESMNPEGVVLLKFWPQGETEPKFYVWKDGLEMKTF